MSELKWISWQCEYRNGSVHFLFFFSFYFLVLLVDWTCTVSNSAGVKLLLIGRKLEFFEKKNAINLKKWLKSVALMINFDKFNWMKDKELISLADLKWNKQVRYQTSFGRLPTQDISTPLVQIAVMKKRCVFFMSYPADRWGDFQLRMDTWNQAPSTVYLNDCR